MNARLCIGTILLMSASYYRGEEMSRIVFVLLGTIFFVKGFYESADVTIEHTDATIPVQTRQQEEAITTNAPSQLEGSAEDDALSVKLSAQLNSDRKAYMTNIEFYNKSGQSLDLIYDCGLLISNDQFASKSDIC